MTPRNALHRSTSPLLLLTALAGLAGPPGAQEVGRGMGSTNFAALAPELTGGATQAAGGAHSGSLALTLGAGASVLSSASYDLVLGAVSDTLPLGLGAEPIVFGVAGGEGPKAGGASATLVGLRFPTLPGSSSVDVGALPATGVVNVSSTEVSFVAPAGTGALGNPLGASDVTYSDVASSTTLDAAYLYLPALVENGPTSLEGGTLQLVYHGTPGDFVVLTYGFTLPGFGLPVDGLDGSLEVLTDLKVVPGLGTAVDGTALYGFPLPYNPPLIGITLDFQAVGITSLAPVAGAFTNVAPVTFQP